MKERLKQLKKMSRQYRWGICGEFCKVWNNGLGCLEFISILVKERKILVNSCLANIIDYKRIAEVFPELKIIKVWFGYPLYYNHSMLWAYEHGYAETKVLFRRYSDGQIIALFPEESEKQVGTVMSYMHNGQHATADYNGVIEQTKQANKNQYQSLLNELRYNMGYNNLLILKQPKTRMSCNTSSKN